MLPLVPWPRGWQPRRGSSVCCGPRRTDPPTCSLTAWRCAHANKFGAYSKEVNEPLVHEDSEVAPGHSLCLTSSLFLAYTTCSSTHRGVGGAVVAHVDGVGPAIRGSSGYHQLLGVPHQQHPLGLILLRGGKDSDCEITTATLL